MIKKYSDLNIPDGSYPGEGINIVEDIYNPILANSIYHKRSTYSFNSYSLVELSEGLEGFVEHGKKLDLLIGETIQEHELRSIVKGKKNVEKGLQDLCLLKLQKLFEQKDTYDGHLYRLGLLTNLIGSEKLEIRFCFYEKGNKPKQHTKLAIFEGTEGEVIAWDSSSNQSQNGLLDSLESLSLFKSWDPLTGYSVHGDRIHQSFSKMWSGGIGDWKTVAVPSSFYRRYAENFPAIKNHSKSKKPDKKEPKALKIEPRKYQEKVIEHWIENKYFGIVQHATGSGKSITGVLAIREFFKTKPTGTCILLVPGDLLLDQWETNINNFIPNANLYLVSSKNPDWKKQIPYISEPNAGPNIIVSSMDSAVTPQFLKSISQGDHLMILGDEAHNLGSPDRSKVLNLRCGAAMALSATIHRPNDDFGNGVINEFFKNFLEPKYGIEDALAEDRLTQYNYHPKSVLLNDSEQKDYENFSKKISRIYAAMQAEKKLEEKQRLSRKFQELAIGRARILKKASGKVPLAVKIISKEFKKGQRWLVYCEDRNHLQALSTALDNENIPTLHYHSNLASKPKENEELKSSVMKIFKSQGGIILSIGCLDEGVDIPSASHALIIASSQNERQYIQRRGRVLRKDSDNPLKVANIYDAIVVSSGMNERDLNRISNIELKRALEFSNYSQNSAISRIKLQEIAINSGIELEDIDTNIEFEEDFEK